MTSSSSRPGCTLRAAGLLGLVAGLGLAGLYLLYQVPAIHDRLFWRVETARADLIRLVRAQPDTLPTPRPADTPAVLADLLATATPLPTPTAAATLAPGAVPGDATALPATVTAAPTQPPTPTATPLPDSVLIEGVAHEYQGWNNCGPATLSMNLRFWGWEGDQLVTAAWLKPNSQDKNVRPDEIEGYVLEQTAGLGAAARVGGTVALMQSLLANGYPVIVGKGLWNGDAGWMGHYLLLVGYDTATQEFIAEDSLHGPDLRLEFEAFDTDWRAFNRTFVLVYPEAQSAEALALLGEYANPAGSHRLALQTAQAETAADPGDAFAWHNLGTNLDFFEQYAEASAAFDEARRIGLPWRMLWYQTGLYSAYYNAGRYSDVQVLANLTLESALVDIEENLYWRGWAKNAQGDAVGAERDFEKALAFNPNFAPAREALAELEGGTPAAGS